MYLSETSTQLHRQSSKVQSCLRSKNPTILFDLQNRYQDSQFSLSTFRFGIYFILFNHHYVVGLH